MKNYIKKYKKIFVRILLIIVALLISVYFPVTIDKYIFGNHYFKNLTNSELSDFLGSYIGSLIGGIFTLVAVLMSFWISRNNQVESETRENSIIVYYDFLLGFKDIKKCYVACYKSDEMKTSIQMYFSKNWIVNVAKLSLTPNETEIMYKIYGFLWDVREILNESDEMDDLKLKLMLKKIFDNSQDIILTSSELNKVAFNENDNKVKGMLKKEVRDIMGLLQENIGLKEEY